MPDFYLGAKQNIKKLQLETPNFVEIKLNECDNCPAKNEYASKWRHLVSSLPLVSTSSRAPTLHVLSSLCFTRWKQQIAALH